MCPRLPRCSKTSVEQSVDIPAEQVIEEVDVAPKTLNSRILQQSPIDHFVELPEAALATNTTKVPKN